MNPAKSYLTGQIAAALMYSRLVYAGSPVIEKLDVLAAKL